jgi:hypothetical protein
MSLARRPLRRSGNGGGGASVPTTEEADARAPTEPSATDARLGALSGAGATAMAAPTPDSAAARPPREPDCIND